MDFKMLYHVITLAEINLLHYYADYKRFAINVQNQWLKIHLAEPQLCNSLCKHGEF